MAAVPGTNNFDFDPTVAPGYVWHCHILEHEENDMMRPLMVSPTYAGSATAITAHRTRSTLRSGQTVRFYGTLTPGELGDSVVIQIMRPGSHTWANLKSVYAGTIRGSAAGWTYTYHPRKRGTYHVRALFGGTADRTASVSGSTHFHVR